MTFGEALRGAREGEGLSRQELARAWRTSHHAIVRAEDDAHQSPRRFISLASGRYGARFDEWMCGRGSVPEDVAEALRDPAFMAAVRGLMGAR